MKKFLRVIAGTAARLPGFAGRLFCRTKRVWLLAALIGVSLPVTAESLGQKKQRLLAPTTNFDRSEQFEVYQGGSGTNMKRLDRNAFSLPSAVLNFEQRSDFFIGNGVFDRPWVVAPSSTVSSDGLGPLFNARSCQGCHIKDGRGHPPEPGDINMVSLLFTLSDNNGNPDPVYGQQFQDKAIVGMKSEGHVRVNYEPVEFTYPDGEIVALRKPVYSTSATLSPGVSLNPRIAPPMIGLGLIEAIADEDLLIHADPTDKNDDGISGRANVLDDGRLGRFGWKSMQPTIEGQTAVAFSNDMGLSTRIHPAPYGDCTRTQTLCRESPHGDSDEQPEVVDELLTLVTFYSANLAVPARRHSDDQLVLKGKQLFYEANCIACHVPKFATKSNAAAEQRNQLIWPYSDFLLHDMGSGLADRNSSDAVEGSEWRTPPLWGVGLTEIVNDHTYFLHDGRARSLEEAILWHGGEAEDSRDSFARLSASERELMLRFLMSL